MAQLTAQQINLNGLVTFAGLDSAAQTKINNAATTAANAASTASTANATANAAALLHEVETISSNLKKFKNVCGITKDTNDFKGAFIITTPITPNRMVSIRIRGYNYLSKNETIDLMIGFYNYSGSITNTGYVNGGSFDPGTVQVAKVSASDTRAVVIIGNADTTWRYPKIIVEEVITGYSTVCPDSYKDGFTIEYAATVPTTYVHTVTLSGSNFKGDIAEVKSTADANDLLLASWCAANNKTLIDGAKLYTGSVTTEKLAALSVTAAKIASGAVTADKISVTSLEAIAAKIGGFTIGSTYLANNSTALGEITAGKADCVYVGIDGVSTNQITTSEYGTYKQTVKMFNGAIELSNVRTDTSSTAGNSASLLCGGSIDLADGTGRNLGISASEMILMNDGAVPGGTAYKVDIPSLYLYSDIQLYGGIWILEQNTGDSFYPYYMAGDVIDVNAYVLDTAGFISSSSTKVYFTVPVSKPIIGSPKVTASSVNGFVLRQRNSSTGGSYTHGSASDTYVKPSSYVAAIMPGGNSIRICATFSTTTNAVNNSPIGIQWSGKIVLS